jgi:Tol biopolymer transport system component
VKAWLALLATLPLLAVGSGATAGNSAPPRNGLIAVRGCDGITIVDPRTGTTRVVPRTEELGQPAWSPDATMLAATSWADESGDSVYTMKPDGSERSLVLRNASWASWSPDGKQLVVVRASDLSTSLAVVNADGTDARLLDGTAEASSPKWSPDGKLIAFLDSNGRVALITPEGDPVPMPTKVEAAGVSWSPDSSKLAYVGYSKEGDGHSIVVALDLASGRETTVPGTRGSSETPTWSPEGDQIAFESMTSTSTPSKCGPDGLWELWVVNVDGSRARNFLLSVPTYSSPSWGQAVASLPAMSTPTKSVPKPNTAPTPNRAPTPNTAPTPTVTSKPTVATKPKVAPKPARTAARPAASSKPLRGANGLIAVRGKGGLYLVDPRTAGSREIPGTAEMWAPAWSPTMKELAVEKAEKGGSSSIYTVRPDGTHPQLVLENASAPSWSAAGDRIFVIRGECTGPCDSEDDAANVLYAVNADGTGAKRVDFDDSDAYTSRELAWPIDGRSLDFFGDESLSGPGSFDSASATWSPDETELAFTGALGPTEDESENNGLWIVSADGGAPTLLLSNAVGRPSWAR